MKKTVILLSGKARSGKNAFGEFLETAFKNNLLFDVSLDSFAKGVKDGCCEDFEPLSNWLNNYTEQLKAQIGSIMSYEKVLPYHLFEKIQSMIDVLKIKYDNWYEEKTPITRILVQQYGTSIFRDRVNENYWAESLKNRILESRKFITIVTDCRFLNEIEAFDSDDFNVITIRIERKQKNNIPTANHISETQLDDYKHWNYIIDNNMGLEELQQSANVVAEDIDKYDCLKEEVKII